LWAKVRISAQVREDHEFEAVILHTPDCELDRQHPET